MLKKIKSLICAIVGYVFNTKKPEPPEKQFTFICPICGEKHLD